MSLYSRAEVLKHMAQEQGITPKELSAAIKDAGWSADRLKLEIAQHRAEMQLAGVVPEAKSEMDEVGAANRAMQSKAWKLGVAAGCNPHAPFPQQIILSDGRVFQKCQRLIHSGVTYIELGRDDPREGVPLDGEDEQARIRYRQALTVLEDELYDIAARAWVEDEGAAVVP